MVDTHRIQGIVWYHNMFVDGEGANPGRDDVLRLASKTDISRADAEHGLDQVRSALTNWPQVASSLGVAAPRVRDIGQRINTQISRLGPTTVTVPTALLVPRVLLLIDQAIRMLVAMVQILGIPQVESKSEFWAEIREFLAALW